VGPGCRRHIIAKGDDAGAFSNKSRGFRPDERVRGL
jgi:hypothetical protein